MIAAEVLAAWQAAADAATGPWEVGHRWVYEVPAADEPSPAPLRHVLRVERHWADDERMAADEERVQRNAEFIALSRDALPRAISALRAVLDLHVPDPTVHALDPWEKGHRAALLNAHAAITAALGVTS